MPTFSKSLQQHLAAYKSSRLGVKEAGVYVHKGKEVRHGHILPKELKWLNLLEQYRTEIREHLNRHPEIRLHKYFHHLNSSQAFALNLFFPFFAAGEPSRLLRALGTRGTAESWAFEMVPDETEGTNVDVAWRDADQNWTYCEVKFSEQEFGVAPSDARHRAKLDKIYKPVLDSVCPATLLEPQRFFANYQLLRNVWLAAKDPSTSVVFLLPSHNEALWKPLLEVKASLKPTLARRIHVASVESVLHKLSVDKSLSQGLASYAKALQEKYSPPPAAA